MNQYTKKELELIKKELPVRLFEGKDINIKGKTLPGHNNMDPDVKSEHFNSPLFCEPFDNGMGYSVHEINKLLKKDIWA